MPETSPFVINDPRFRTSRFPGFRSVPGDTGGNVAAPGPLSAAASSTIPRPTTELGNVGLDDRGNAENEAVGAVGVGAEVGAGSLGLSDRTVSSQDFDVVGLAESLGKGLGALGGAFVGSPVGPIGTVAGAKVGAGVGAKVARAGAEALGFSSPLSEQEVEALASPNAPNIGTSSREGSGVVSSNPEFDPAASFEDFDVNVDTSPDFDPAADFADFDAGEGAGEGETGVDSSSEGGNDADAGAGGGGDEGGGGAGGDEGDEGDEGDPERAGGPVVANQPGGTARRIAHDGEFVLQSEIAGALGEDALQLLNSGEFVPAEVRRALGLPPASNAAMPGVTTGLPGGQTAIPTGKSALRRPSTGLANVGA